MLPEKMLISTLGNEQDAFAWDQYVLGNPKASGYHLTAWRRVIQESFGHPTFYLIARDHQGNIRGVLPLAFLSSRMFGKFLVSLPFVNYGGLIADNDEAMADLREAAIDRARALKAEHIELRHTGVCDIGWASSQRKVSMRLELPAQFEALWQRFPSKLRSQIRRAQKEGMSVRFGGSECVSDFYTVFSRCMRDLGTPVYAKRFFESTLSVFSKEARICVVSLDAVPLAAGFLYGFRGTLEIPWAASDKRYSKLSPNMLLYSSILEFACKQGFQVFDFGRSTPKSGTYRFKEQWGAQPTPLYWYYWSSEGRAIPQLNPQNPKYRFAIKAWQHLPLFAANLLGPRIVKHLP